MKDYDMLLNIKTGGIVKTKSQINFDYEATFYKDLIELFETIKLTEKDHLVDLGSGLGRILFLTSHLFNNYAKGIELRRKLHKKALKNLRNFNGNKDKIKLLNINVLDYKVEDNDNYFFFYNSFDVDVLKEVVSRIDESIANHKRDVYIILAFPFVEYVEFFLKDTDYKIKEVIEARENEFKRNRFLILAK